MNSAPIPTHHPETDEAAEERCDCGCCAPVATQPLEMLRFLAGRLAYAGTSDAVAQRYAEDIKALLAGFGDADEIAPQDLLDAKRYRFLREEAGVMWLGGRHLWLSHERLDEQVDKAIQVQTAIHNRRPT